MPAKETYTGPRYTFCHQQLGNLTGRLIDLPHFSSSPVVQFRSIPYATVPARFLPSIQLKQIPLDGEFDDRPSGDFTHYGAACPQTTGGASNPHWCDPWEGPLEDDENFEFNEFTCLTVSISVPESQLAAISTGTKLPVMVYLHGGGAQEGVGHVDGLHSNAPITAYAASISQPVITVNIGYRLNWLGSLVCQDVLEEYTASPTSLNGPFNLAMQDQRTAFAWIDEFISGFGGDASSVTAFAESAGSIFLTYHICGSPTRLFDRAILQSGLVFGDLPLEVKEGEYQALLKHFNIDGGTAAARLDALRQIDAQTLAQYPGTHLFPYVGTIPGIATEDSLFTRGIPTVTSQMELVPTCEWLNDIVIGDDFWEGAVFYPLLFSLPQSTLIQAVKMLFPAPEADALLAAYSLPSPGTADTDPAPIPVSLFMGDLTFSAVHNELSNALATNPNAKKRNIYRYSFALTNPFPNSGFVGSTLPGHHFVEILYVFLTLLDRYSPERDNWLGHQARETARRWIAFANGKEPWEAYTAPQKVDESGSRKAGDETNVSHKKESGIKSPKKFDLTNAKIAICDDIVGWTVRTLKVDEEVSKKDSWGERRYAGWRAFDSAFEALRVRGEDTSAISHSQKVNTAKMTLLQLAFTSGVQKGMVKVPKMEGK